MTDSKKLFVNGVASSAPSLTIFQKTLSILWPIKRDELKKFLPMALMMLFTLFNYNVLRSLKDAMLVPNIGAEAISFVKSYIVPPAAIIVMLAYAKMTTFMSRERIYYTWIVIFSSFYIIFGTLLYPYMHFIHPDPGVIEALSQAKVTLLFFDIDLAHFKWFIKLYGQWVFPLFYVFAELWGSVMLSLLFWQFANDVTKTKEAKKFYPMFGFIANIGLIVGGLLLKFFSKTSYMISALLTLVIASCAVLIFLRYYINTKVLTDPRYALESGKKTKKKKPKLSFMEGLKVVFSSKYIGYIAVLLLSYGISMNLIEGPWKAKVRELFPSQNQYADFMGTLQIFTGAVSMIAMLIGANILNKISWFSGAVLTPLILAVTGLGFFVFVVFDQVINVYLSAWFSFFSPLWFAVMFGLMQNVCSKGTKYSFFDPTKEMSYIPIDEELKTKGKAAADVVAARFAKSGGAMIQSMLFIIFPAATFVTITPYLMIIFIIVSIIWIADVKLLSTEYEKALEIFKKNDRND